MAADQATLDAVIAAIRSRANTTGNDEAKIMSGSGTPITGPTLNGATVPGTFVQGEGLKDADGGASGMKSYAEGLADFVVTEAPPTGSVLMFAGTSVPSGWLECDGAAVSRTTYAVLFSVIGVTYGDPGATQFNLPDFSARFPRGTTGAPASTGGSDTNSHTHALVAGAATGPDTTSLAVGPPSDTENRPAFLEMKFMIKA